MLPTLIVVEDDAAHRRVIANAARMVGQVKVLEFEGATAARQLIKYCDSELARRHCVMFLDLGLGAESGLEVLRQCRAHLMLKRMPVVVLTSSREEADKLLSYEFGVNAYVVKPKDEDELRQVALRATAFWLHRTVLPGQSRP